MGYVCDIVESCGVVFRKASPSFRVLKSVNKPETSMWMASDAAQLSKCVPKPKGPSPGLDEYFYNKTLVGRGSARDE
jgi:hypothetical protein